MGISRGGAAQIESEDVALIFAHSQIADGERTVLPLLHGEKSVAEPGNPLNPSVLLQWPVEFSVATMPVNLQRPLW